MDNFKVVLLGESGIGKSCIADRLLKDTYNSRTESTVGAGFIALRQDNRLYQVWDTAGQERYRALVAQYYRHADVVILVYDLHDLTTLGVLHEYMNRIQDELTGNYKIIVVGNKCDLIGLNDIVIKMDQVKRNFDQYSKNNFNRIDYLIVSAKSGHNINQLFETLRRACDSLTELNNKEKLSRNLLEPHKHVIRLESPYKPEDPEPDNCPCS